MQKEGIGRHGEAEIEARIQRIRFLQSLVQAGLETPDCLGFHATSIEAVEFYMDNGRMPGRTGRVYKEPHLPQEGDIYFYSFDATVNENSGIAGSYSKEKGLSQARAYAVMIGRSYRFVNLLGLPLSKGMNPYVTSVAEYGGGCIPKNKQDADYENYHEIYDLRPEEEMRRIIREARKARGIVMGVSRRILQYGLPRSGDDGYDARVNVHTIPMGDMFSGMRLMGSLERKFFASLHKG